MTGTPGPAEKGPTSEYSSQKTPNDGLTVTQGGFVGMGRSAIRNKLTNSVLQEMSAVGGEPSHP
jgi:hypothetical protein